MEVYKKIEMLEKRIKEQYYILLIEHEKGRRISEHILRIIKNLREVQEELKQCYGERRCKENGYGG